MGETGWGGLAVFVGALAALLLVGVRALRRARDEEAFAPLALVCLVIVIVVDSTGDPDLFSWNAITAVALLAGATLAQERRARAAIAVAPHDPWAALLARPAAVAAGGR
jgi:hypothetical protein